MSTVAFPENIAAHISVLDQGPSPLFHADFGPNNIVLDDGYNVLGVIHWEHTCSMPWDTVEFPTTVQLVPAPVDVPWKYDENGAPKGEETRDWKKSDRQAVADQS